MQKIELRKLGKALKESTTETKFAAAIARVRADIIVLDKLLKEANKLGLLDLAEEAIEVQSAENVWKESKDSSKTYISNAVYFVKPVEGDSKYEVTIEKGGKRKPFATLSKIDLDKSFTLMRPNQTPDAEGYVQYRDIEEVEAFAYGNDTVKLNTGSLLSKGDYLVRKVNGDDFIYEVHKAKDFESSYAAK